MTDPIAVDGNFRGVVFDTSLIIAGTVPDTYRMFGSFQVTPKFGKRFFFFLFFFFSFFGGDMNNRRLIGNFYICSGYTARVQGNILKSEGCRLVLTVAKCQGP